MHAAGVVIGDEPLWNYVPCFRGKNGEIVTQYNMTDVEQAGLVKFDFLGLKTLTVIETAVKIINKQRVTTGEEPFDLDFIPMDDDSVYQMIWQRGYHRRVPAGILGFPRNSQEAQAE